MTNIEEKVDMSLDELVSLRRDEAKKTEKKKPAGAKKAPAKNAKKGAAAKGAKQQGGAKQSPKKKPAKPTKQAVNQAANKMKRQQQMNSRRGIGGAPRRPRFGGTRLESRSSGRTGVMPRA